MIIRKVDSRNDWVFGKGLADYATQEQAIEENIKTRILSWSGDCFFAQQEGVDWRARLDVGQQQNLLAEVKGIILRSFGVVSINTVSAVFDGKTRRYTITYDIQTIFSSSFQSIIQQAAGTTGG